MAIGYAKIILNKFDEYYEDLLNDLGENFTLFTENSINIFSLNYDGELIIIESKTGKEILSEKKCLNLKFVNKFGNFITLSICLIDDYIFEENYSMDEFLINEDEEQLLVFLKQRFDRLLINKIAMGFIFDVKGFSEDYILIPPPDWRNNSCWRTLMDG